MRILTFDEIIEKAGFDASKSRLVRHNAEIAAEYRFGMRFFLHAITYQPAALDPFLNADTAYQFLPGPVLPDGDQTALFVGAFRIGERWLFDDGSKTAPLHCYDERCFQPKQDTIVYDIHELEEFTCFRERILIRWGSASSARSWSQWASRQTKEVIELRMTPNEPAFPGFAHFTATLEELPSIPASWQGALRSVSGVYLLVCPETGEQYVGSAYGEDGFWGRWLAYCSNGHGGNRLLANRPRQNYAVSILEVASPDMALRDIINREVAWKEKLGSRAHGLNAN